MKRTFSFIASVIMCLPALAYAQTGGPTEGVFTCNGGKYAQSVGSQSARAGVYVPVADATTELNTGILVYKECVLRPIQDRMREAVTAGLVKLNQSTVQSGRNGSAMFVVNPIKELSDTMDAAVYPLLQTGLETLNPAFREKIKSEVARGYILATRNANSALTCDYQGDLNAVLNGTTKDVWGGLAAQLNPACSPMGARMLAYDTVMSRATLAANVQQKQWDWNRGWYSVTDNADDPLNRNTVTPGSLVEAITTQGITSGFRQVENANDIGQMVGALFAGLGSQTLTSSQGLAGLLQPNGGQTSYLQQIVNQAQSGLQGAINNAALAILQSALQVEQQYFQTVNAIANALNQTINGIRAQENTCWDLIIQHACSASSTPAMQSGKLTCTDPNGTTLHIATSTAYSQAIISSQVAPYASSTIININASQQALNLIAGLIQSVAGASASAQQVAVQQLNALIAQHALHVQSDLATVSQQQQSLTTVLQNLLETLARTWGDGNPDPTNPSNPNSGWCNVNNPTTISMWQQIWSK